jgi:hypothetical protein
VTYPDPPAFPDAVALVAAAFAAVELSPVFTQVPNPRPDESDAYWLLLTLTGGSDVSGVLDNPTVTVDSWSPRQQEAHDLAQYVRQLVKAIRGTVLNGTPVGRVIANSLSYFPDPVAAVPRYRQSFHLITRGT